MDFVSLDAVYDLRAEVEFDTEPMAVFPLAHCECGSAAAEGIKNNIARHS